MERRNKDNKPFKERKYTAKYVTEATQKEAQDEEIRVTEYLNTHPQFLAKYIEDKVSVNTFEEIYFSKVKNIVHDKPNEYTTIGKQQLLDILSVRYSSELLFMWEITQTIVESMRGEAFCIFKLHPDNAGDIRVFNIDPKGPQPQLLKLIRAEYRDKVYIREAARRGNCLYLPQNTDLLELMQPGTLFKAYDFHGELTDLEHVLLVPILDEDGQPTYMVKIWRTYLFDQVDIKIGGDFMVWASLAKAYFQRMDDKKRKLSVYEFLLDTVKTIFEDMACLDQVIKRILRVAQKLVNADRASLFLVDFINQELVSTVFDMQFGKPYHNIGKREIRIPINCGIAGYVAISGQSVNICNAYADVRFNRKVDVVTGYKTTSILCMPVKIEGRVIAVAQMINNREQLQFSAEDEESFEMFATFFGLALHHARLYNKIVHNEQKYRVAIDVLTYHTTCRSTEVEDFLKLGPCDKVTQLVDFSLDPSSFTISEKCKTVITMFQCLFDMRKFNIITLIRFILTVKKNYRNVPYHNFDHSWAVAQSTFAMLMNDNSPQRFRHTERLALFVASLCHDLDHRGYTNKYTSETASPLAAMYTTSTLEHHHFNITVMILQQDGHNIFAYYSSEEYMEILGLIRSCILATDLANFFPNLKCIQKLIKENKFDWRNDEHRELAMAMSMTAADLSASAKPWAVQLKTVRVIFQEFYNQGDKEKAAGKMPIPMMDRDKPELLPACQVDFLKQICIPCYEVMATILPQTKELLKMASKNLKKWETTALEKSLRTKLGKAYQNTGASCVGLSHKNFTMLSPVHEMSAETSPSDDIYQCPDTVLSIPPKSLRRPEIGESSRTIHPEIDATPTNLVPITLDETESLSLLCVNFGCACQKKS